MNMVHDSVTIILKLFQGSALNYISFNASFGNLTEQSVKLSFRSDINSSLLLTIAHMTVTDNGVQKCLPELSTKFVSK